MRKLYAILIASLLLCNANLKAQCSCTCGTALAITPANTCNLTTYTTSSSADQMWFSFAAQSANVSITLINQNTFGTNAPHIHNLALYGGTCSNLTPIADDELPFVNGADTLAIDLDASGLTVGATYYIRVLRPAATTSCSAGACTAASSTAPSTFNLCVQNVNVVIPKDFGLELPAISHAYYQNRGQLVDVNGNPRPDIKLYTANVSPAVYIANDFVSYVYAKVDTIASTPDTLQRVDMTLVGANPIRTFKTEKVPGVLNYFLAHIPQGVTGNKGFSRAVENDVYPNIDMQFYSNAVGVKFYFIVRPGGDANNIVMNFAGANAVNVTASGGLNVVTSLGTLNFEAAHAYQVNPSGNIVPMPWQAKFIQLSPTQVKFDIRNYTANMPLFIQVDRGHALPSNIQNLEWSTYYGGNGGDAFNDSKTDASNNLYMTGLASSTNFPVLNAYIGTNAGSNDAVVLKFNPDGSRNWATYFGGSNTDIANGVAVDPSGNVFVVGWTISTDFPTTGGNPGGGAYYQPSINTSVGSGYPDVFMFKLLPGGNSAPWRTYYGGGGGDYGNAIAIDGSGNIFITGQTESNNFPVRFASGAYLQGLAGPYGADRDAFIIKFSGSNLNNIWATYYGGTNSGTGEEGKDITVDWQGNVYVTGRTPSADFPTLNPGGSTYFDGTLGGTGDAFLLKFSNVGARQYATYYGGSGYEIGNSVITDGGLGVFLTGSTTSSDFPTQPFGTGFIQSTIGSTSASDAFLVKLGSDLSRQWSTYYGGAGTDVGLDLDVDNTHGIISLTGNTQSNNLPLPNPPNSYNQSYAGLDDIYIASFDGFFLNNVWGTYLGGSGTDIGNAIVSDANSKLFVVGQTGSSTNFPLDNGGGIPYYQGTFGGSSNDGCITRFDITVVVGVNEINFSSNDISVYPNPTSNLLNVTFSNKNNSTVKFFVYNTLGEMVHSTDLGKKSGDSSYIYNTSNLNAGVYFIQVQTENGTASKMFVKQ